MSATSPIRVDRVVTSGVFALDGGEWDVDNNIWLVGNDDEVVVIDAAHTAQPIIDASATAGSWRSCARTRTTTTSRCARAVREARRADPAEPGRQHAVGSHSPGGRARHARGRRPNQGCRYGHPGDRDARPFAGLDLPVRAGGRGAVHRRHPVLGWARRDRTLVLGLPDDHRVDPRQTVRPAGGDDRAHRHGDGTTLGTESPHLEEWIKRGS